MKIVKIASSYGFLLALVALLCTTLSFSIYFLTSERIDLAIAEQQQALLQEVVPTSYFDNNLVESYEIPKSPKLSSIKKVYFAIKNKQITAYAYETVAPDGYSGNIRLLIGLTPKGEILGVRVIEHKETPGLGDKIELRISNWILSFNNQLIHSNNLSQWAVKKDGGKFDQFSGATITPRAVVNQVKRSALIMLENQTLLECKRVICYGKG
ncbi:electron transport complex subunit RsxG [Rodentibacter caecimuris]|uniref:Ion-translocating oxidoreductase complex subunit G n=1 Tax=Rodentibacter caecimuris TaxID=1796644 RepID=A0ABX3KX97_9PAST|nr:electron transport complex subunit RsxG [Rodentibacter heylii]